MVSHIFRLKYGQLDVRLEVSGVTKSCRRCYLIAKCEVRKVKCEFELRDVENRNDVFAVSFLI